MRAVSKYSSLSVSNSSRYSHFRCSPAALSRASSSKPSVFPTRAIYPREERIIGNSSTEQVVPSTCAVPCTASPEPRTSPVPRRHGFPSAKYLPPSAGRCTAAYRCLPSPDSTATYAGSLCQGRATGVRFRRWTRYESFHQWQGIDL